MTDKLIQDANRALKEAEIELHSRRTIIESQANLIQSLAEENEAMQRDLALAECRIADLEENREVEEHRYA